jgi:SOS-response transcriptional repressor LexA
VNLLIFLSASYYDVLLQKRFEEKQFLQVQAPYREIVCHARQMINAGIDDGDYVVIRKQSTANEGQIVVALIDGEEATLKRFYIDKRKRKIRLHPENDNLKDMYYDTIDIQGIVVKVIKDVE